MSFSKKVKEVEKYYDEWTKHYVVAGYGDVIQAHRPPDVLELLKHICKQADIKDGLKILDAGCGICGPAIYFAQNFDVQITAVTNSAEQVKMAKEKISKASLKGSIEVIHADFHKLDTLFAAESFDLVVMLESFGHAINKSKVLSGVAQVLKEGHVYIKDYFSKEITGSRTRKQAMKRIIRNMNKHYSYNLADLNETIKCLRLLNLDLQYVKINELRVEDQFFLKNFEANHNIDIYEGGFRYLFLEPLELNFIKPLEIDGVIK